MTAVFKKFLLLVLLCAAAVTAVAADIDRGQTVESRPRPDYDPKGAQVGGFTAFADIKAELMYDDNIRATEKSDPYYLDDSILLLAPQISLESDWSRHMLNAGGRVLAARFNDFSDEDYTDYELWADGALDMGVNSLGVHLSHSRLHQLRTSPNDEGGKSPTEFTADNATFKYRFSPNRAYADLSLELENIDFDDTKYLVGPPVNNDDRDRLLTDARLRLGYKVSPGYSVFLEPRFYDVDYDLAQDRYGRNRDSDGYDIVAGAEFDFSGVTFGEFFVGYRSIDYADPAFEKQDGSTFGASIDWNVTQLTTFTFLASKKIYGTTYRDSSGVESSGIETAELDISIDHELRRNIILNAAVIFQDEDFLQTTRNDDVQLLRIGADYLLSRRWRMNAGYTYQKRDSTDPLAKDFRINQVYLGVLAQI